MEVCNEDVRPEMAGVGPNTSNSAFAPEKKGGINSYLTRHAHEIILCCVGKERMRRPLVVFEVP